MTSHDDDTLIPTRADVHELDYTPAVPYRGPRAGHEWPGWGGCECGLPWSAHEEGS